MGDVRNCLPLTSADLRFLKLSVWAPDHTLLGCVFPVGSTNNLNPGDDATWTDEGVPGQSRSQLHVTPAFDYRNFWFVNGFSGSTIIATFSSAAEAGLALTVDVTVQYRTTPQSCPAATYLAELRAAERLQTHS